MPALTLANLAAYSLRVAALIGTGAAALWVLRVRAPRVRLFCLRAMLVACLVLPFVATVPGSNPPQPAAARAGEQHGRADLQMTVIGRGSSPGPDGVSGPHAAESDQRAARQSGTARLLAILPIVLLAGIAVRLLWLAVGLVALNRLRNRAQSIARSDSRPPALTVTRSSPFPGIETAAALVGVRADFLVSATLKRPVTFGLLRPVVMLPPTFAALDEAEQVAIAAHELLHVRRRDWVQTVGEELLRAVSWWHPAVWWLLAQIDLGREQIVDQEVVALTERRQPYVNALVRLALVPAGPVLRPASLFLGRAHLLERVALLSREVRMSRWRLAVSVVLVAAALVVGGHFVVQAVPLTAVAQAAALVPPAAPAATAASSPAFAPSAPAETTPPPALGAGTVAPQNQSPQTSSMNMAPRVLQSVPPNLAPGNVEPGKDAVVAIAATVGPSGTVDGPVAMWADNGQAQAAGNDPATTSRVIDGRMIAPAAAAQMHAALEAVRLWRFEAPAAASNVYVGFNFAADQSASVEPMRVGGDIRQPLRIKDVRPVYPEEAQNRGLQGVVILDLLIDGPTGIPAQGVALRPVGSLTLAALEAALQWRFAPMPEVPKLRMTVTVNFTLDGGVAGGIAGGVRGGVAGGVAGGVQGGVAGGVASRTPLPIPAGWPAPVRVGGNIKAPTKILDVKPVYPPVAQQARVQGVVILEVLIGPDGKVADAQILRSIPLLDQAAFDAVKQWQFTPTLLNGAPVPVIMTCTVNFSLEDDQHNQVASAQTVTFSRRQVMPDGSITEVRATMTPDGVYRQGPGVIPPRVVRDVKPSYNLEAMQDKVQGTVVVEAVVGPDGVVQDVRVIKPLDPRLDQRAVEAAYQWQFQPGTKDGVPVPVLVTIELVFKLA